MSKGSLLDFLREGDGRFLQFEDLIYIGKNFDFIVYSTFIMSLKI